MPRSFAWDNKSLPMYIEFNFFTFSQHWIANNLFGLAFSINGVEFLQLNKVSTGCILLGGLFFYDIFWVFGTNVMVTVAKSFEAPIKCEKYCMSIVILDFFSCLRRCNVNNFDFLFSGVPSRFIGEGSCC